MRCKILIAIGVIFLCYGFDDGLRIGVQEMTRYGMQEADMQRLAGLMADAIKGQTVKDALQALRAEFVELQYV